MSETVDQYHLLQTVVETDYTLSSWADHLSSNIFLELGSDPQLVAEIEHDLEQLTKRILAFDNQFDIAKTPVHKANIYFTTASQLENTVSLVKNIRQQAYGTLQNTRRCVEQLNLCIQGIREVSQVIQPDVFSLRH